LQADGTAPLRYQWRLNGVNIRGETNATYNIESVSRDIAGSYSVAIANDAGVRISDKAVLICSDIPNYPGGGFLNPAPLPPPGLSSIQGFVQSDTSNATKDPTEPDLDGRPGSASIWYRWTPAFNGVAQFDTRGSTFDTLLAVYQLSTAGAPVRVASDDDTAGHLWSVVRFNARLNQTYLIGIDGLNTNRGMAVLAWNLIQALTLPDILEQPRSQSGLPGESLALSVLATPDSAANPLSYQWFFNGEAIPGATAPSFEVQNLKPRLIGSYTVRVKDPTSGLFLDSRPAIVEIGSVPGIVSRDKVEDLLLNSASANGSGLLAESFSGGPPPFISVSVGIPGFQIMNNTNSTADIDCFRISTATRWLGIQVTNSPSAIGSVLRVDTSASAIPTELAVYHWSSLSCLQSLSCMHANIIACDTNSAGGSYSLIRFPAVPGENYICFADGVDGAMGVIDFNWQLGIPPKLDITKVNCSLLYSNGTNVTLVSGVTNAIPAAKFQWYRYGTPLANATNSALAFTPIQSSDAGCYTVVASNLFGVVTNQCCVIVDPPQLRCEPSFSDYPPLMNVKGALLPGCVLEMATNVTPTVQWQSVLTNTYTNCYFLYPSPMFDIYGQALPPRFYRTRRP
jgi:hypothetical protein